MRTLLSLSLAISAVFGSSLCAHAQGQTTKQGVADYNAGHYTEAATNLTKSLTSDFNDPIVHYYLGSTYVRLKQKDAAIREFRIAMALQPDKDVGRLSKQALAMLGVETGSDVDVTSMFIVPAAPKPKIAPDVLAAGGKDLADTIAKLQTAYVARIFSPPSNGADHSQQLQALGPEWRAQERFDDSKLPMARCEGPWFRLPNWLAGTWKSAETVTETVSQDFVNKTERKGEISMARPVKITRFGVVSDKQGAYWEHPCVPRITRDTTGGTTKIEVSVRYIPVENSTQRLTTYSRWINFQLTADYKIKNTTQYELISTITPIGSGNCQRLDSLKSFDEKGSPLTVSKYRYYITLAQQPMVPVHDANGYDYTAGFRKYLKDNNLSSLAP